MTCSRVLSCNSSLRVVPLLFVLGADRKHLAPAVNFELLYVHGGLKTASFVARQPKSSALHSSTAF